MAEPSDAAKRFQTIGEEMTGVERPRPPKKQEPKKQEPKRSGDQRRSFDENFSEDDGLSRTEREILRQRELQRLNRYKRPSHDRVACVKVDCETCDAGGPTTWMTREGDVLQIRKMMDSHLFNAAKYMLVSDSREQEEFRRSRLARDMAPLIFRSRMYRALVNELRRRNIKPPKDLSDW
jgi:hypothetical protein